MGSGATDHGAGSAGLGFWFSDPCGFCGFLQGNRTGHKRSHNLAKAAKPGWTRFGFPRMYQTDVLEVSQLLVRLGVRDARMDEALELIESKREPDGRWLLKDTFNGSFSRPLRPPGLSPKSTFRAT